MMVIIDCSVILSAVLPDESNAYADRVLAELESTEITGCVPAIFHLEAANVLSVALRRKRITPKEASVGLDAIGLLPFKVDTEIAHPATVKRVWELVHACGLTAYDACYLELAHRHQCPLATLDTALIKAAHQHDLHYAA